jgi:transcriptional regulator with PAS, ATPase and Fis domain
MYWAAGFFLGVYQDDLPGSVHLLARLSKIWPLAVAATVEVGQQRTAAGTGRRSASPTRESVSGRRTRRNSSRPSPRSMPLSSGVTKGPAWVCTSAANGPSCLEDALRERDEQVRLLLDSTAEAIYGIDLQGNCTFCNSACLRLLGYAAPSDLLGKNMHALMHDKRSDGTPYLVEECHIYQAHRRNQGTHINDEIF